MGAAQTVPAMAAEHVVEEDTPGWRAEARKNGTYKLVVTRMTYEMYDQTPDPPCPREAIRAVVFAVDFCPRVIAAVEWAKRVAPRANFVEVKISASSLFGKSRGEESLKVDGTLNVIGTTQAIWLDSLITILSSCVRTTPTGDGRSLVGTLHLGRLKLRRQALLPDPKNLSDAITTSENVFLPCCIPRAYRKKLDAVHRASTGERVRYGSAPKKPRWNPY
jgi:hypothetical protein